MRKVGVVKTEAGEVEVKEFRVRDVVNLFEEAQGGDQTAQTLGLDTGQDLIE